MLGLVLIYILGKYFYELARKFDKNLWGNAIFGVLVYYLGTFAGGIILVVAMGITSEGTLEEIDSFDERALNLMSLPFGLLAAYLLYRYLEKRWTNEFTKKSTDHSSEILDDEFFD